MKKRRLILSLVILILCVVSFFIIKIYIDKSNTENNIDFSIGVIETSAVDENSYVNLYSLEGELNGVVKLNVSDVNSGFLFPIRDEDHVYLNSHGTYKNATDEVIEYDLKNNKYSTHKISTGIISLAKYEDYLFTTYDNIINKYDINSKEIVGSITIPAFASHINVLNGQLYAFGQLLSDKDKNVMYIIDINSMEIIKTIALEDRSYQSDSMIINDIIYFTNRFDPNDNGKSLLGKYSTQTGILTYVKLPNGYGNELRIKENNLFISSYDSVQRIGSSINILNLEDYSIKELKFNHRVESFEIYEDKIIILGDSKIYIYKINDFKAELVNEFNVKNTNKKNYRISGFFVK